MNLTIKELNDFWTLFVFISLNPVGNLLERLLSRPLSPIVALCCLTHKDVVSLCVFHNREPISLIIFSKRYNKINYLYVKKKYRNLGIAKTLIKFSKCDVAVSCGNSRKFWNDLGFKREISHNVFIK